MAPENEEQYDQDVEHEEVEPEGQPTTVEEEESFQEAQAQSNLETSQPDVPVDAPESVPVAEGATNQGSEPTTDADDSSATETEVTPEAPTQE